MGKKWKYKPSPERLQAQEVMRGECLAFRDWARQNAIPPNVNLGWFRRGWEAACVETHDDESRYPRTLSTRLFVTSSGEGVIRSNVGGYPGLDWVKPADIARRKQQYLQERA